jgi:predicted small secreted protein
MTKKSESSDVLRLAIGIAASMALSCSALVAAGCNTTEGIGEDISATGDAIDNAAEDAND